MLSLWLIAASPAALAVDPVLHNSPELWRDQLPATLMPAAPLPAGASSSVEVSDIQELGPKPRPEDAPIDLWERMRSGFAIPELVSPLVVARQRWYAERPEQLRIVVERSRRYLFHIVEELERRGMPTELALLPMVESAYNPLAYSRAHASGLWQFIPSTGKNYKLEQNWWYDGRRDIVASTNAALDYLQSLHNQFGDWHLALAAYNWGENGVQRAIDRNRAQRKPAHYQALSMPKETRLYVPSFQGLKNIIANPAAFGVALDSIPNAPYFVTVTLTRDIDLHVAARLADMPVNELIALNPGHNRPVVQSEVSPQLVLPADRADVFVANLEMHDKPLSSWQTYTFKASDKLERLAAQHGMSVARLKAINGIRPNANPVAGQQLLLPEKGAAADPLPPLFTPPASALGRVASYVVKAGDAWESIARAFGVRIDDLKRWNEGAQLIAGELLVIQMPPPKRFIKQPVKPKAKQTTKSAPTRPSAPTRVARPSSSS
jgi:membrane-bound lytic murein transglycosylase D